VGPPLWGKRTRPPCDAVAACQLVAAQIGRQAKALHAQLFDQLLGVASAADLHPEKDLGPALGSAIR